MCVLILDHVHLSPAVREAVALRQTLLRKSEASPCKTQEVIVQSATVCGWSLSGNYTK